MEITIFESKHSNQVIDLFRQTFTDSEGAEEGDTIARLVKDLIETTDPKELIGFITHSRNKLIGCIFFSNFILGDDTKALILSPVAVKTDQQSKGVGQNLINFGIEYIKKLNINVLITYGDPNYYKRFGFCNINESTITAPQKLSFPEGWMALPLKNNLIKPIKGKSKCVKALNKAKYW